MSSLNFKEDNSSFIESELNDILTIDSCTTLVCELIKFILYRKQQLPYTFDRLKYLICKRKLKGDKDFATGLPSVERQFKVAENGLATLELLFEKTKDELANSRESCITELALLFGSTPMSPKQVYVIHLPQVCFDHYSINHPEKKHLVHLLQSVILSSTFTNLLMKPMSPTNMYVFIKKKKCNSGYDNNISEWFIPKKRYEIPNTGQHFHIKFRQPITYVANCRCKNFKIYNDDQKDDVNDDEGNSFLPEFKDSNNQSEDVKQDDNSESEWYQACAIFKGFTDVYVNGVSVADLWLR